MILNAMKKQPYLILSIYLIFAVTGYTAFSAAGTPPGYAGPGKSDSAYFFYTIDHDINWAAAGASAAKRTNSYLYLPRNKLPCVFALAAINFSPAVYFVKSSSSVINNDNTIIYKNNILLKLLI